MKSFDLGKSIRIVMIFLGIFVLSQMFLQPKDIVVLAQANQDIDDVMQSFDADFGFQGKEDLKQTNLQNTNEQNREDIKIQEEEERQQQNQTTTMPTVGTTTTSTTPPPVLTSDVMITFGSVGVSNLVAINLGAILGFSGTLPASPAVQVVTFLTVPQGNQSLGIMCNSGTCNLNASSGVNVACSSAFPFSTGPFGATFSLGCVVS